MNRTLVAACVGAAVLLLLVGASLFTVEQTEQVLITQFGRPIRVIDKPGLHTKLPFLQAALSFDRRLLDVEVPGDEVILADQRRLIVDSFTRFRIVDPLRYYQAVGANEEAIRARLNAVVSSSLRRVLGNEQLLEVLSADRDRIMGTIRVQVNDEMKSFGVAVEDVRIRRADLPEENTQAILKRMQSERERVAHQARAEGAEARPAFAPTPSATARSCSPRRVPPPTGYAARANTRPSASMRRRIRRTRNSSLHGVPCRPIATLSPPAPTGCS